MGTIWPTLNTNFQHSVSMQGDEVFGYKKRGIVDNMINVNVILGILALIGVSVVIIGNILEDDFDWIIIDIYSVIVFSLLGYRLFSLRKI